MYDEDFARHPVKRARDEDDALRRNKQKQLASPTNRNKPTPGGDLLCIGTTNLMSLPTITNPAEKPCAADLRYGKLCTLHAEGKCKKCHKPINALTPESKQEWKAHVLSTDGLFFNSDTVTCFPAEPGLYEKPSERFLKKKKQGHRG